MQDGIEQWESEGGAVGATKRLTGTESQVNWANQIRSRVDGEFDRVASAFSVAALGHTGQQRLDIEGIIGILECLRAEVMTREEAGYFIHDWQELRDQVRQMVFHDARYQVIKSNWTARRRPKRLEELTDS